MDENKTYSAEDLLRYAHGQMPMAERYALEKAALEDPFLAEALDGYVETTDEGLQTNDHGQRALMPELNEFRKIIAEKAEEKKEEKQAPIITIWRSKMLQRAVAAILLFGTAWWLYSISNVSNVSKKEPVVANNQQIAQNQPPIVKDKDSILADIPAKQTPTVASAYETPHEKIETSHQKIRTSSAILEKKTVLVDNKSFTAVAPTKNSYDTVASTTKVMALNESVADNSNAYKKENPLQTVVVGYGTQRKSASTLQNISVSKKPSFVFKGRILDAGNNPLPFSSVVVPGEDFGTYSDGEGYFNFVYTDSILPVRAKSLGFEPQNFNMLSNKKENRIVLNEDKNLDKSLTFLRSAKQKRAADFKPTIIKVDSISSTVEPFVGWRNYDLYLTNNNRISEIPQISSRSVQLSFEVSQDGGIKNITIEKSQGKDLDAEAIRLLKEGPKWKAKKNGEKGKVEVKF